MKWKIAAISLLVLLGIIIAGYNIYLAYQPPDQPLEKVVILSGKDLPADPEALGLGTSNGDDILAIVGSVTFKDEVKSAKEAPYVSQLATTITVTNEGDSLLVLVNKTIRLPDSYFPKDLISVDKSIISSFGGMQLRTAVADNLIKIFNDAKAKGYNLHLNSSYRSYQTQVVTYNYWVSQVGVVQADRFSARPGHSQHQLGTTVDITSDSVDKKLVAAFGTTPEGKWLANNAYKYGFVLAYPSGYENITGYTYEPWHFRYIGVGNAQKWKNSGLILEEYLKKFGVW